MAAPTGAQVSPYSMPQILTEMKCSFVPPAAKMQKHTFEKCLETSCSTVRRENNVN